MQCRCILLLVVATVRIGNVICEEKDTMTVTLRTSIVQNLDQRKL